MKAVRLAEMIVFAVLITTAAGAAPSGPSASDVLSHVEKNYSGINDYRADVTISVKTPQMHIPKNQATIYYKKPDKVKVAAKEGFAVLPNTFPGNPVTEIKRNFAVTLDGAATVGKEPVYVLNLKPKTTQAGGTMKIYVEKKRWLIIKTLAEAGGTKITSEWSYTKAEGKYWLPSRIKFNFSGMMSGSSFGPDERVGKPPIAGNGTAEIRFSNYKVNKGISDNVFVEKKDKK